MYMYIATMKWIEQEWYKILLEQVWTVFLKYAYAVQAPGLQE